MSEIVNIVTNAIEPVIPEPFELVDVEWEKMGQDNILRISLDKPEGISLGDTVELTELISPVLDQIQPDPFPTEYMLEVTSPGAERPLKKVSDFEKNIGNHIYVSLYTKVDKNKEYVGDLVSFDGKKLVIDYLDKSRKKQVEIEFRNIAKARTAVRL